MLVLPDTVPDCSDLKNTPEKLLSDFRKIFSRMTGKSGPDRFRRAVFFIIAARGPHVP
jgi:hypothetical protein